MLPGSYGFIVADFKGYTGLRYNFSIEEQCSIGEVAIDGIALNAAPAVRKNSTYKRVIDLQ